MTSQTSMLHVRIDDETKLQAQQALKSMGMSVSDAVRIFLTRVVAEHSLQHSRHTRIRRFRLMYVYPIPQL